jgi:hypothetical protein
VLIANDAKSIKCTPLVRWQLICSPRKEDWGMSLRCIGNNNVVELKGDRNRKLISIMIKRWLLQILEHGTVPAVALALAIAPTDSRSWQRHDLTLPTKQGTEILFSAPMTDTMTLPAREHGPVVASAKVRPERPRSRSQQSAVQGTIFKQSELGLHSERAIMREYKKLRINPSPEGDLILGTRGNSLALAKLSWLAFFCRIPKISRFAAPNWV